MAKGKYKRKRLNKIRKETLIQNTSLPEKVKNIMKMVNISTLYDLDFFSEEELSKIPGIGETYLKRIMELKESDKQN